MVTEEAATAVPAAEPKPAPKRQRLSGREREQAIVTEAVSFFAEQGLDGHTRELAKRLGVTQSLIFKYFPSKAALIDRVYDEVYVGRWNPFWESVIRDRRISVEDRLSRLYVEYAKTALTWDWVRIFMFSGLRGDGINQRYLEVLRSKILEPVAQELRHELGLADVAAVPLSPAEMELVWGINARVFYFGQRRWIFNVPVEGELDDMIRLTIRHFMAGVRAVLPELVASAASRRPVRRNLRRIRAAGKS